MVQAHYYRFYHSSLSAAQRRVGKLNLGAGEIAILEDIHCLRVVVSDLVKE